VFTCPTRRALRAVASQGTPAYMYHFTYKGDWIDQALLGDYHASELFFVWPNEWPPIVHAYTARDRTMSDTFTKYWANVAWYAQPNGKNDTAPGIPWPAFEWGMKKNIVMDVPARVEENQASAVCEFWDQIKAMEDA